MPNTRSAPCKQHKCANIHGQVERMLRISNEIYRDGRSLKSEPRLHLIRSDYLPQGDGRLLQARREGSAMTQHIEHCFHSFEFFGESLSLPSWCR